MKLREALIAALQHKTELRGPNEHGLLHVEGAYLVRSYRYKENGTLPIVTLTVYDILSDAWMLYRDGKLFEPPAAK